MSRKVQKAKRNFYVNDDGKRITLCIKTIGGGRKFINIVAHVMLGIVGGLLAFIGILAGGTGLSLYFLIPAAGAFILQWIVHIWSQKRSENCIHIEDTGIEILGKFYPFHDIDGIGWKFGDQKSRYSMSVSTSGSSWRSGMERIVQDANDLAHDASGKVFIKFGDKNVYISKTLKEDETEEVFKLLRQSMIKKGYEFEAERF